MSYRNDTDTQTSKVIHINSEDGSVVYTSGHTTDFSYQLENVISIPENQKALVSCIGATIPYTFYNIRTGLNDLISFRVSEGGTIIPATLAVGNYNSTTFATEVKRAVDAALSSAGSSIRITLSYSRETMKYTLTFTNLATPLFFVSSQSRFPYIELGITKGQDNYSISSGSTFENVSDVNGNIHGLYLRTDLVSDGVYDSQSKSLSHILAKIPIKVNFGGVIFYNSFEGVNHKIELDKRHIDNIRVRLTDERNRLIDLNGLNFTIAILFDFVYKKQPIPELSKESRRIQEIALEKQINTKPKERRGRPRKVGRPKENKDITENPKILIAD